MNNPFLKSSLKFNSNKGTSLELIKEVLIEDFPDKESFIEFYLSTNGVLFKERVFFYPDKFYSNINKDYNPIELTSFLHVNNENNDDNFETDSITEVLERRLLISEEFEDFIDFHFPFADNFYADTDFWIDIQTGEVKYMDYEGMLYNPNKAIAIAPSFKDFCEGLSNSTD